MLTNAEDYFGKGQRTENLDNMGNILLSLPRFLVCLGLRQIGEYIIP